MPKTDSIIAHFADAESNSGNSRRRRRRRRRLPQWRRPAGVESRYATMLISMVNVVQALAKQYIGQNLQRWAQESNNVRGDSTRTDAWYDELERAVEQIRISLSTDPPFRAERLARNIANETDVFNKTQWVKITRAAVGVKILTDEQWILNTVEPFVKANVHLITELADDHINSIRDTVMRGVRSGARHEQIAKELFASNIPGTKYRNAKNRAKLIARDQVGKLNGQLTEQRQKDVGVDEYIWHTSGDSRVRDEHASRNGKRFKWSEPPWDGHPGEPINCFPSSTKVVLSAGYEKAFRRFYRGPLTTIVTDAGISIEGTPNHPILTWRGWLSLNDIKVGDYIIKTTGDSVGNALRENDHFEAPLDEIFQFFSILGNITPRAGSRDNFHGDGSDETIYIVSTDTCLLEMCDALDRQKLSKLLLTVSEMSPSDFSRFADLPSLIRRMNRAASSSVCGFGKLLALLWGCARHSDKHSFATIQRLQPEFDQMSANNSPFTSKMFCHGFFADPLAVELCDSDLVQFYSVVCRTVMLGGRINTLSPETLAKSVRIMTKHLSNVGKGVTFGHQNLCRFELLGGDVVPVGSNEPPGTELYSDGFTVKSNDLSDTLQRQPFAIQPLRVVDVNCRQWSGHVLNLQTDCGHYRLSNNIVVRNCRCYAEPIFGDEFDSKEVKNATYGKVTK
jgi:SPP1 gp7 family putative phage head morphogenesis protein